MSVQQVLESFDALTDRDKHDLAVEIFRRVAIADDLSDEDLSYSADELFQELDSEENGNASR